MDPRVRWITALGVAVALGGPVACSEGTPEAELREAQARLERAREELQTERARVAEEQERLEACRQDLAKAREDLEKTRREVARAESRRDEHATDVAIFRAVQSELLADETLRSAAVRAEVAGGVVTLKGRVHDERARRRAVEIAEGVAGVQRVESRIEVRDPAGE